MPRDTHLVPPGSRVDLGATDPAGTPGLSKHGDKARSRARAEHQENVEAMKVLQHRLRAESARSILIVLQGMDTSGKDGAIRHVIGPLNPQGVRVVAFKVPTPEERAHDFLWRVHKCTPASGEIVVFNRSHYEDVLVARVHGLVEQDVWERRFGQINDFERLLADHDTVILKLFLHISRQEQKERLQARLDNPAKRWKFSIGDLDERNRWDQYQAAYEDALGRCSAGHAPWFVIPADRKWYRNWAISSILRSVMEEMDPHPPAAEFNPADIVIT